jgi:hypothetical protein
MNAPKVSDTEILLQLVADLSASVADLAQDLADSSKFDTDQIRLQNLRNKIETVGGIARQHLVSRVGSKGLDRVAAVTRAGGLP